MTNPSDEYMRRIRREERDKLLDLRRERAVKALRSLDLHGGSHAMLSQIAYAIHPHVGAWDEGACDHLRNVLAELIGGDHEGASDAQHHCACGAGGCDRGHESAEVETERQEAVCELRKLPNKWDEAFDWYHSLSRAIGLDINKISYANARDRLIHLLGGDLSHDTNSMRQESETRITDELRKYVSIHETTTTVYATMPPQMEEEPTHKGKKLLAIADKIDAQFARVCEQQERVLQDTIDEMSEERDKARREVVELRKNRYELQRKCDELQAKLDELERFDPEIAIEAFGDDNKELRKLLSRAARLLADAEMDRDENYHLWMDCKQKVLQSNITVGELEDECDELQGTIADLNEQLERRKDKCLRYKTHIDQMQGGSKRLRKELRGQEGTYLDLLRDAAKDYKALLDKLNLVFDMWANATITKGTHE